MMLAMTPMARTSKREDHSLVPEAGDSQDHGGDDGDFVALENVGRHAGTVADVVADVVGDRGGVPRVVLGNSLLDLSDEVGPDVGGLRVNSAADPHEEGQQRSAEPEAQQGLVSVLAVDQKDDRAAEQAEAVGQHAGDRSGAVTELQGLAEAVLSGRCHAQVSDRGQPHPHESDRRREDRTEEEGGGSADGDFRGRARRLGRRNRGPP